MEIRTQKEELQNLVAQSEKVKNSFKALVLVCPQIIDETDMAELKSQLDTIAANFETACAFIYEYSRMGVSSKKFTTIQK